VYSVLLPDGRNQVVTYVSDENGYNVKVNYEGEANPQRSQPGIQGGYPSVPGFLSTAPKYPPAPIRGSAPRPTGYPGSAVPDPGYPSSGPAALPDPAGYPGSAYFSGSPPPLSYLVQFPTFKNGVKGSSRPKTWNFN